MKKNEKETFERMLLKKKRREEEEREQQWLKFKALGIWFVQ